MQLSTASTGYDVTEAEATDTDTPSRGAQSNPICHLPPSSISKKPVQCAKSLTYITGLNHGEATTGGGEKKPVYHPHKGVQECSVFYVMFDKGSERVSRGPSL